jgi:hypothetical protein
MSEIQWRIMYGERPQVGDAWKTLSKIYYVHDVEQLEGMHTYRVLLEISDE